ncbi:hemerythrin domain-containing protein [Anaerocolumna sp. AGMB13025]|uniref:hemerythrin domain-containing protein n=1 Tax=Anaerocolumna sp. AGMB13025 TaxID=3039116 RepID=UPI00241F939B|nr:hemerythrin domain-containing protein [Anaerocolumna sp. AGMB13025]WFR59569.1 hemerythrin domain-containing protein [Anaerocolumna sp. AGMB13025]
MNSIDLMVNEHKYIMRMLKVVRKACYLILKGQDIDYEDFNQIIDFIRNYADMHHHGKEEKFLFKEMQSHLGGIGDNLVTHGMLVEHDLGRLYISDLDDALKRVKSGEEESKLDVISNAVSYTHLLTRHIEKEDAVVYTYGGKNLPEHILNDINQKSELFEKEAKGQGIQDKYIKILEGLENKYN